MWAKKNLNDIFENKKNWEFLDKKKNLGKEQKLKGIDENNLNIMINLLMERSKGKINKNLIKKIK